VLKNYFKHVLYYSLRFMSRD